MDSYGNPIKSYYYENESQFTTQYPCYLSAQIQIPDGTYNIYCEPAHYNEVDQNWTVVHNRFENNNLRILYLKMDDYANPIEYRQVLYNGVNAEYTYGNSYSIFNAQFYR